MVLPSRFSVVLGAPGFQTIPAKVLSIETFVHFDVDGQTHCRSFIDGLNENLIYIEKKIVFSVYLMDSELFFLFFSPARNR